MPFTNRLNKLWNLWQPLCIADPYTTDEADMGSSLKTVRNVGYAGGALAALLLGASIAGAQEAPATADFTDNHAQTAAQGPALDLRLRQDTDQRFQQINPVNRGEPQGPRRLELALAAGGGNAPVDISLAQRGSLGSDTNGDLNQRGHGQELRVGSNLVREGRDRSAGEPSVYAFVASDDQALTWQPGTRSEFGGRGSSLALEERTEVGDMAAGVTYERNGVQASLAYVERSESARVGSRTFSQDQNFAGVTVTMRH
jgi:hypothetical protein